MESTASSEATTSPQGHPAEPAPEAAQVAIRKARGALTRYRFMALLTGAMLLVLCAEMLLKYVLHADGVVQFIAWVPFAHGWIYVVYLVTVLDLWTKMRWGWGRLAAMVAAGVIPVMSFVLERRVHADADLTLTGLEQKYGVVEPGGVSE